MTVAKISAEFARNVARARDDSAALWRLLHSTLAAEAAPSLPLRLRGRYCAGGADEFDGCASELSPRGLRVEGPYEPVVGAWCAVNLPDIGIVEGPAVESAPGVFILGVVAPAWRLQRLALRFAWRIRRDAAQVDERRRSARVEMNRAKATLAAADGRESLCEIFDLSEGGAALHLGSAALYFWDDQPVTLDDRPARVLRHFPGGLVIQFESET